MPVLLRLRLWLHCSCGRCCSCHCCCRYGGAEAGQGGGGGRGASRGLYGPPPAMASLPSMRTMTSLDPPPGPFAVPFAEQRVPDRQGLIIDPRRWAGPERRRRAAPRGRRGAPPREHPAVLHRPDTA